MMDFLRGLASHHGNEATSAMPAVPSRFESDQPLRAVPPRKQPREFVDDPEGNAAARASAPSVPPRFDQVEAGSSIREPEAVTPPPVAPASPSPRAAIPSRPAKPADIPHSPPTAGTVHPTPAAAVFRPEYRTRRVPEDATMAGSASGSNHVDSDRGVQVPAVAPVVLPRHTTAGADAPLSRRRVEAHAEQRAERRTVVHVTIDRVDVSAPSAADRPKPPARSRRVTPSQPLAEYLRARHPGQRGDAP